VIRVHIAHDNHLLRDALAAALAHETDIEVVEVSPEGAAGLDAFDDRRADVLILWVPWRTKPFDEIARYRRAAPTTKIVGLYTHSSVRNEMIAAGADEVVDEADGMAPLLGAIRRLMPLL
jgi:DNA-binding NarL/FixJ family response regulator